jgi:ribonuclease HII
MRVLGLDEAGRGSVLGPLVVGGFLYVGEDQGPRRHAGAEDSKVLTARRRDEVRMRLASIGRGEVVEIPATEIDEANLNALELTAFVHLVAVFRPDRVYLDAPVAPRGFQRLRDVLIERTGVSDWVIENHADATWPVVGAASIFAKTTRDARVDALGPVGSGYPSDPVTRALLCDLLAAERPLPPWVRRRWATLDQLRQQPLFGR